MTETLTNNVRLSGVDRQAEQVTEISPGFSIHLSGDRIKGNFDYALNEIFYAKNSAPSRTQKSLNTFATLEAADGWAFIDFNGSISQQFVSAFGPQSIDYAVINANRAEVSVFQISPYVRARLGEIASYEARYSRAVLNTDAAVISNFSTDEATIKVTGDSALWNLGWLADASRQDVNYSAGRATTSDQFTLGLSYALSPEIRLSAHAGKESNNYTSTENQRYSTSGVGINWAVSEMTKFAASRDRRSFGYRHSVSLLHRTPRTVWTFGDSKDVLVSTVQLSGGGLGSVFDLLYSQFASIEPNAVARRQLVNAYLQANGLAPNAIAVNSFLTSSLLLQRRQDLSFALIGVRDTITLFATRSESKRLDTLSSSIDDFNSSAVVRQRGFSANYAHRLTPDSSLAVFLSQQKASGQTGLQDITVQMFNINVAAKWGKQTMASIGFRHVVSSGNSVPYLENALTCNFNIQF